MGISIKKNLIFNLMLSVLSLLCPSIILLLKIINKKFTITTTPLQYTSCTIYFQEKYSPPQLYNVVDNVQLILATLMEVLVIIRLGYIVVRQMPEKLEDIILSNWFRAEYCMHSLTVICLTCCAVRNVNLFRQRQSCQGIQATNAIVMTVLALGGLLIKIIVMGVNFYLLSMTKFQRSVRDEQSDYSMRQGNSQFKKLLNQDTRDICQALLNQHTMPFNLSSFNGMQNSNKFSQFRKNFEARTRNKFKKNNGIENQQEGGDNIFDENGEDGQFYQKQQELVEEEKDTGRQVYDRQKVNEVGKGTIQQLKQFGYDVEERPYVQKVILSKKFKTARQVKDNNPLTKQSATSNPQNSKPGAIPQLHPQQQQQIGIVINMNTAEQRIPSSFYNDQDMQPIQLDKMFYREYLEKENKQKQQLRMKLIMMRRKQQNQKKFQDSQRLKCSYQKYLQEDVVYEKRYQQMRNYASKPKQRIPGMVFQELALHVKNKINRYQGNTQIQKEIKELLKDQIRINHEKEDQTKTNHNNRNRNKNKTDSSYGKMKEKKNPLETIRGKWAIGMDKC